MILLRMMFFIALCIPFTISSKLVFFLVDGFRWDYFKLPGLKSRGFSRLFQQGTRAEWMVPDFPTNSFPNYKTLETGLHVESHGMVGNFMFDETSGKRFEISLHDSESLHHEWWNMSESFFTTAEKQGLSTALYYVPGGHIPVNGIVPSYCIPYSEIPNKREIDWAIDDALEQMKHNGINIAYIYHERVDKMGHLYGPNSKQVLEAVREVDDSVDKMLDIIEANKQTDVDVIVLSDHGMSAIDKLHKINISEVLDMADVREITEGGTQAYLWPVSGKEKQVYNKLKSFHPHLHVFLRDEIKERWFFKKHRLIPPIFLTADKGWFIVHPKSPEGFCNTDDTILEGNHGFDNNDQDMRSIFMAYGPDFRKNFIAKPFSNVNVYQVVCHVSGIKARPNNGTWSEVKDMFVETKRHNEL